VRIGSVLIQSDNSTGEPLLLHTMLPECVRDRSQAQKSWVFLLDAQIGTAASAFMAIRVLLDHGVPQDHIVFVTFLVARKGGIAMLQRAFPQVKIVTGAVDDHLEEVWLAHQAEIEDAPQIAGKKVWVVEPGMGQMGKYP
jgi:uridine kinase